MVILGQTMNVMTIKKIINITIVAMGGDVDKYMKCINDWAQ